MNVTLLSIEMNQWIQNSIQRCQISYSSFTASLLSSSSSAASSSSSLNNHNNNDNAANDGWLINEPFNYMDKNDYYGDDESTLCIQSVANKAVAVLRWMR